MRDDRAGEAGRAEVEAFGRCVVVGGYHFAGEGEIELFEDGLHACVVGFGGDEKPFAGRESGEDVIEQRAGEALLSMLGMDRQELHEGPTDETLRAGGLPDEERRCDVVRARDEAPTRRDGRPAIAREGVECVDGGVIVDAGEADHGQMISTRP